VGLKRLLELEEEGLVEVVEGGLRGEKEGELDGGERYLTSDEALLVERGGRYWHRNQNGGYSQSICGICPD
jgi:hypothetical protein